MPVDPKRKKTLSDRSVSKKLRESGRKQLEEEFAAKFASVSDGELYEYVKEQKRLLGKKMTRANTVGYAYLVKRLGPWDVFMGRIGRELAEEAQGPENKEKDGEQG